MKNEQGGTQKPGRRLYEVISYYGCAGFLSGKIIRRTAAEGGTGKDFCIGTGSPDA